MRCIYINRERGTKKTHHRALRSYSVKAHTHHDQDLTQVLKNIEMVIRVVVNTRAYMMIQYDSTTA